MVAFANTAGGTLIIGKESNGKLVGVREVLKEEERLANAIAHNILPSVLPEIEIVTVQGKDLLVVKVSHWKGPFYLKRQGIPEGVYFETGERNLRYMLNQLAKEGSVTKEGRGRTTVWRRL